MKEKIQKGYKKNGVRMESLSERNENQRYENAKKWHKRRIKIIAGLIGTAILFAIIINVWSYNTKDYNSYKVLESIKRTDSTSTSYTEYNNKLMKYSRDGAVGFNEKLDMNWSGSFQFNTPIIDSCGSYVAISDQGGTEIYVFDGSDSPKEIDVLYPISHIRISKQGVLAVMMSRDNSDLAQIYDSSNGKLLVEFTTNVSEDGYPVDIALSSDGTKLVTSYLNVTSGSPTSKVTFYNLGEVGKNYSNSIVSAKTYEKEIISKVEFLGNSTICVFGEQKFYLYSMKQLVQDIKTKNFKKKIKSIFFTEEKFGFVFEPTGSKDSCTLEMYDLSGKVQMDRKIDFNYSTVYMSGDEIIFIADQECHILRKNGREKLNCIFKTPVSYLLPVSGFNRYILVDDTSISSIKITEDK